MNDIFVDEKEFKKFYERVIPEISSDQVMISILVARKKYDRKLSRSVEILDKCILKKRNLDYITTKLRKFCTVKDMYIDEGNENYISSDAMAVYIDIFPKSTLKASVMLMSKLNNILYESIENMDTKKTFTHIDSFLFSCIAKSTSEQNFYILDVDKKDEDLLCDIVDESNVNPLWISETRGGFHVIFRRTKDVGKSLHDIQQLYDFVEFRGRNGQTPVVGSLQAGFLVKEYVPKTF